MPMLSILMLLVSRQLQAWIQLKSLQKEPLVYLWSQHFKLSKMKSHKFKKTDWLLLKVKLTVNLLFITITLWFLKNNKTFNGRKKLKLNKWKPDTKLLWIHNKMGFHKVILLTKCKLIHLLNNKQLLLDKQRQKKKKMMMFQLLWDLCHKIRKKKLSKTKDNKNLIKSEIRLVTQDLVSVCVSPMALF